VSGGDEDDRALAVAFLRGDEPAFRELYRRHTPAVHGLARRLLGARPADADAEDLVQETWLRAARGLGGFRWESSLRTWLLGIVVNLARERSRRGGPPLAPLDGEPALPEAGRALGDVDLERALLALAEGYREVLLLHDVWGLTHDEVGRALGIDAGTSKSQLSRARRALKQRLLAGAERKVRTP
jgi:RNA polymerase sigma-70 factor (ECF subfamily)